jgi:hypothetical protein
LPIRQNEQAISGQQTLLMALAWPLLGLVLILAFEPKGPTRQH